MLRLREPRPTTNVLGYARRSGAAALLRPKPLAAMALATLLMLFATLLVARVLVARSYHDRSAQSFCGNCAEAILAPVKHMNPVHETSLALFSPGAGFACAVQSVRFTYR